MSSFLTKPTTPLLVLLHGPLSAFVPRHRHHLQEPATSRAQVCHPTNPPLPLPRHPHPPHPRHLHRAHPPLPPLLPWAPPPRPQVQVLVLTLRSLSSHSNDADDQQLLQRVCTIVEDLFASDRNMEAVLDRSGITPTAPLVLQVLDRFRHAHRPAYRFFRWAGGKEGFRHDGVTYVKMLDVLGRTRQFESMVGLMEEMGREGGGAERRSVQGGGEGVCGGEGDEEGGWGFWGDGAVWVGGRGGGVQRYVARSGDGEDGEGGTGAV